MNSDPPSTWTDWTGNGMSASTASRNRFAFPAEARENTRQTMTRLTGSTARNSLSGCPSRLTVMWSIWTSSPGLSAFMPKRQRLAWPEAKSLRRFGSARPRSQATG